MSVNDKFFIKNVFEMVHIFQGYMCSKPLDHGDGIDACMPRALMEA